MLALLNDAIAAHGGMERWNAFSELSVTIVTGGDFWAIKHVWQDAEPRRMSIALRRQWGSVAPFGKPGWRSDFTRDRVAILSAEGAVVQSRDDPEASFAGHTLETPWDALHRAYFNGYALWTYLTTPWLLAAPDFEAEEIAPWREGGETWRGVRAHFPNSVVSHSAAQDFYFGDDLLLRRHDYFMDIAGGFAAAQYVSDFSDAQGLRFPTRRRAYMRAGDLTPMQDRVMVSIDLSDFQLT